MKYLIIFIAVLVVIIIGTLILGGVFFTAAVSDAEIATHTPELKVTVIYDVPMPEEHQQIVREWCEGLDIDERLIYGIIYAESGFDPDAQNPETGCYGYMQLNPSVYQRERFSDPKANLTAGIMELARLRCIYRDATMVLMCYNNGEAGAHRLIAKGITSTAYTRKVLEYAEELKINGRMHEEVEE